MSLAQMFISVGNAAMETRSQDNTDAISSFKLSCFLLHSTVHYSGAYSLCVIHSYSLLLKTNNNKNEHVLVIIISLFDCCFKRLFVFVCLS